MNSTKIFLFIKLLNKILWLWRWKKLRGYIDKWGLDRVQARNGHWHPEMSLAYWCSLYLCPAVKGPTLLSLAYLMFVVHVPGYKGPHNIVQNLFFNVQTSKCLDFMNREQGPTYLFHVPGNIKAMLFICFLTYMLTRA